MIKNIFFFCITFGVLACLCTSHCWLGWHTFWWGGDTASMVLLDMCGWHPAIVAWLLKGIYVFTGVHIYPLLLLQIIPFYLAIFIIIWLVYYRWHSIFAFLLLLLFCTRQFYLLPVELLSTSFSAAWVLLLYSLVVYSVLNPLKKRATKIIFYTITAIVFFVALNSRANAIIQVWPITLIWVGQYLNKKELKIWSYLRKFVFYSFLNGVACITLIFSSNAVMVSSDLENVYPATPTFVHQIVGACVPANDKSCFDESWWTPEWKNMKDRWLALGTKYKEFPLLADAFAASWRPYKPFKHHAKLKDLHKKWIYAITKHPGNFINHILPFYKKMWFLSYKDEPIIKTKILPDDAFEEASYYPNPLSEREKQQRHELASQIKPAEFRIFWDRKRDFYGRLLTDYGPFVDAIYFVVLNFILFFIGLFLWLKKRWDNDRLLLMGVALGGVLSNILIPLFTPATWIRYMHPVYTCGTVGLCIFIPMAISMVVNSTYWKKIKKKKVSS